MSYIVKTVKHEDNTDIKKLENILQRVIKEKRNLIQILIKKLEENGYLIGKKIKIE